MAATTFKDDMTEETFEDVDINPSLQDENKRLENLLEAFQNIFRINSSRTNFEHPRFDLTDNILARYKSSGWITSKSMRDNKKRIRPTKCYLGCEEVGFTSQDLACRGLQAQDYKTGKTRKAELMGNGQP